MSRQISKTVRRLSLFLAGCCVTIACAVPPPWTVVLTPSPVTAPRTRYVKVSGVWSPAQYYPRPPPTESPEKWGLLVNCRPTVKVSNLVQHRLIELPASVPPPATLVYNPRQILMAAITRVVDESGDKKALCARLIQIESLNISWNIFPSGMGDWAAIFEVHIKLSIIDLDGQVMTTRASSIKLVGLDSSSETEQVRLTSTAGNDAVYGALVEGIDDLLSGSDR